MRRRLPGPRAAHGARGRSRPAGRGSGLRRAVGRAVPALACALALAATATAGPAVAEELGRRHEETGRNTEFRFTGTPFPAYVEQVRAMIAATRGDLAPERRLRIIDANSPFEWRPTAPECRRTRGLPYRDGVLLIHGLTDSPYQMRDVARFFRARCFLVRAILLPGHGTVPGDLLSVSYEAWIQAAHYGVESFFHPREVERVFIAAFSTGGTLALLEGVERDRVRGLVLFSPAVQVNSRWGFLANWPKAISWALPRWRWMQIAPDEDLAKYESFPFNAAYQIYLLTQRLEQEAARHGTRMPLFVALSEDDTTVDAAQTVAFFQRQHDPRSRMVLYTNRRAADGDPRIERRPSAYPQLGVLDFSHLGIHIAPDNPHYGRDGDYRNCVTYLGDPAKRRACQAGGAGVPSGETTRANKARGVVRRLTYNPDFAHLMGDVAAFLEQVP